ncbi:MAG: guanylate kinase [Lachnospiraceae bacterium]|nr:guanylate kinase [Lachnospiraceae bacterium]
MTDQKGILFVLSGFSGAGKGTIMQSFFEQYEGFVLTISATSREPRENEEHGVHYFFVTREEFEDRIRNGNLIEYTEYQGNYYGTPRDFVVSNLEKGLDVFLEIEVEGAENIRKQYPDAVTIFVTTPTPQELQRRLRGRGTNTEEQIRGRLKRAVEEATLVDNYDYLLINDDLDECVRTLHAITQSEHRKQNRTPDFDEWFKGELTKMLEQEES